MSTDPGLDLKARSDRTDPGLDLKARSDRAQVHDQAQLPIKGYLTLFFALAFL